MFTSSAIISRSLNISSSNSVRKLLFSHSTMYKRDIPSHNFYSPQRRNGYNYYSTNTGIDNSNHPDLPSIVDEINRNHRVLICMRGAPGSGKSYLARIVVDRTINDGQYDNYIFSADDYFYDQRTKRYNYDRNKIRDAHSSTTSRVAQRAQNGWSPIIVDNTNMKLWHLHKYVQFGIANGYSIKILEPIARWAKSVDELVQRNRHNVDRKQIELMLANYEPGTVTEILNHLQLRPVEPKLRTFPPIRNQYGYTDNWRRT